MGSLTRSWVSISRLVSLAPDGGFLELVLGIILYWKILLEIPGADTVLFELFE